MASVTLSDYLLRSVIWFSIAALVAMLLLLLNIVRLRIRLIARRNHEHQFLEVWQPLLAAAIAGERNELPPLENDDLILFLKLWNHLHEALRGKARRQLNNIALRLGMMEQAYLLLQSRSLGSKLLALTTLGNLQDRHDWKTILELAQQPDPLLSLAASRALFQIDADAALHDLKQQLIERKDWPTAQLTVLMKEAGTEKIYAALADSAASLAAAADPLDLTRLNRLLHLLEAAPYQLLIPAIRSILTAARDDEIIAQCLRFLSEPTDLHFVRTNVAHPNWVVRLQVARALGRFGAMDDATHLAALLSDPVWWVRYRAAQAIMALMHDDLQGLAELRAHLNDKFALDMLDMVTAERGQK